MRHWIYCKTAAYSLSVLLCQSCSNAVSSPDHEYLIFKFCCPWSEMYIASCIPSPTICLFPYLGYLLLTPDNSNSLRFSYSECSSHRKMTVFLNDNDSQRAKRPPTHFLECRLCVKSILSIFHDFIDLWRKSAIVVFWHELDSTAEKTHPRISTAQQTWKWDIRKLSHTQVSLKNSSFGT